MNVLRLPSNRQGELFVVALTLIEAWFPIFAFFSVHALGGLHAYFYSLTIAVVFLGITWAVRKKAHEIVRTDAYLDLALTSVFITALFALTFIGLQYTSANNVAILLFMQILFSYLFLGRMKGEQLSTRQTLGAALMTLGAILVLFPEHFHLQLGDALVLLAAMIAPLANLFQKRARTKVSAETVLLTRSLFALPFLYLLAYTFENSNSWQAIQSQWIWLFLTGFLVFFVSKILWVEAIHRLPITKVNALYALAPMLTMVWSYILLNETPTQSQLLGIGPILLGSYWVTQTPKTLERV